MSPSIGRCLKVGDNVDTDMIIPGKYLSILDADELSQHALEGYDPGFPSRIGRGDILVAGENFGCGSSREHAPLALKVAGVRAIVAESCARIFFRNAVNIGLPVIICPGCSSFQEGADIALDLVTGTVSSSVHALKFEPFSSEVKEILDAGGLVEVVRRRLHGS